MSIPQWALAAVAVLGICAVVLMIERGIDAFFRSEEHDDF